jgi:hypothetical protein
MPHPLLGLPPANPFAAHPEAAARLRADRDRIGRLALQAALGHEPRLAEAYDALMLRRILRDYDRHIEQLARALETGESRFVTMYGEQIIPAYRRRGIRANHHIIFIIGLRDAAQGVVPAEAVDDLRAHVDAWTAQVRRHARLPGDHKGNKLVRFIWKGAGLGDDTVV